jgi:hypothetical protein
MESASVIPPFLTSFVPVNVIEDAETLLQARVDELQPYHDNLRGPDPRTVVDAKTGLPDNNPKTAYGIKKPSLAKIPPAALIHLAVVMGLGAKKYGAYNWRETQVAASVYLDAADRHILSWLDGESIDPESGASHLAHAMACLAIILDAEACGCLVDDRPPAGAAAALIRRFSETGSLSQ